jgi:general secretion pathway protein F
VPEFVYKVKKTAQTVLDGTIEAESVDQAVAGLLRSGVVPLEITERSVSVDISQPHKIPARSPKISRPEVGHFTRQLADMLEAGVTELSALQFVRRQNRCPQTKAVIDLVISRVHDGLPLSAALAGFPESFPSLYIHLVRAGEVSGRLNVAFSRLADLLEQQAEFRSQIVSALIYPGLIVVSGSATVFVLLTFVIPRLTFLFSDFDQSLPLATVILLGISNILAKTWWIFPGAGMVGVYFFRRHPRRKEFQAGWGRVCFRLPLIGDFIREQECANFFRTLAVLLENGVKIVPALEAGTAVLVNAVFKPAGLRARDLVVEGKGLMSALKAAGVFSEEDIAMLAAAENSNRIALGFSRLAEYHERRMRQILKIVTTLIEPVLILLVGSVIGFMVIALLLPILRMNMIIN